MKDNDPAANAMKLKKSMNTCVLGLDDKALPVFFMAPSSEDVPEHTKGDEHAETILNSTCTCKTTSDESECKC